ncbi:TPA: sugar phosphate isomerase/epimerase [Candidatus Latescibacteria bacterium]|nr:sugar phosphate isomerase/epimerase [Candidatus Latescibacterota bacterium]
MKMAFTTLGCPAWDLDTVIEKGSAFGYDGVDFRGIQGEIDVTTLAEFTTSIVETKRKLGDAGLSVCGISSSLKICDDTLARANLEEAKRTIPVAAELDVPNIRVFGVGNADEKSKEELADIGQGMMGQILALDGADQFKWVFETHDHWIKSTDCKLLLDRVTVPIFGALWDVGHTSRVGEEDPADTLTALGDRVYYTHVKDAVYDPDQENAMKDGWKYVPPGKGQLPLEKALNLLKERGYEGYVMFEHEKRWHPTLPEPEDIMPMFVNWFKGLNL